MIPALPLDPDWGSGPTGNGKLYKVSYNDAAHPQPALVWAAGPREVRIEFDQRVPPDMLRAVLSKATLTGGKYARAGDRFETIWPGYAVVQMQKLSPRFDVPIRSAQVTPDGRTLILATDSVQRGVNYALTLRDESHGKSDAKDVLPQHATVDVDFDLTP